MRRPLFCEITESVDASLRGVISDPDFQVMGRPELRLVIAKGSEEIASDYLVAEIARSPKNLKNHIYRIWLQYDRNNSPLLFAALFDLWLALDGSGKILFRRMLLGAESVLEAAQFEWLVSLDSSKEMRHAKSPECLGSVLDAGLSGRLDLVRVAMESEGTIKRDPLHEARECLEYSQVEQAQQILESALLEEPLREALHADLLDIYKSTHDLVALNNMRSKLDCDVVSILAQWDELEERLAQESER